MFQRWDSTLLVKKWRILYDGSEPYNVGVIRCRVLLDPLKVHQLVARALANDRQRCRLVGGALQLRIEGGPHVSKVRQKTDEGLEVLPKLRNAVEPRNSKNPSKSGSGK